MQSNSVKNLALGLGYKGGSPSVFAKNVTENGDYATVCFLVGTRNGQLKDNDKILLQMSNNFNTPSYQQQVKDFLKGIEPSISFANECPTGCFLDPSKVLAKAKQRFKLMGFEEKAILENKAQLHRIYVSAIENNKAAELPQEFKYEFENGSLYPILQVYRAVCELI